MRSFLLTAVAGCSNSKHPHRGGVADKGMCVVSPMRIAHARKFYKMNANYKNVLKTKNHNSIGLGRAIPANNAGRQEIKRLIARSHRASADMKASQKFNVGTNAATRFLQAQINTERAKRQAWYAELINIQESI